MDVNWAYIGKQVFEAGCFLVSICAISWCAGVFFTIGQEVVYKHQDEEDDENA